MDFILRRNFVFCSAWELHLAEYSKNRTQYRGVFGAPMKNSIIKWRLIVFYVKNSRLW